MISITNLNKSFSNIQVLKKISLEVQKGDVLAVIGPSGGGKTTLLRCMNFLESADSGTLEFDGKFYDLAKITKKEIAQIRSRTAFVFQNFNLFLNKTALQNITEGLITVRKMGKKAAEEKALSLLEKVGLEDKRNAYPQQLSGGQQQRVAIARALASDPEIIYFDEPTSALDPELTGEVLDVMRELAKEGMTMVVVTHELAFAKAVANKTIFMENGQIVEWGNSEQIFSDPISPRTKEFIKSSAGKK